MRAAVGVGNIEVQRLAQAERPAVRGRKALFDHFHLLRLHHRDQVGEVDHGAFALRPMLVHGDAFERQQPAGAGIDRGAHRRRDARGDDPARGQAAQQRCRHRAAAAVAEADHRDGSDHLPFLQGLMKLEVPTTGCTSRLITRFQRTTPRAST